MKGSGRFGKYGDLKRKQKIRQNRQAQPVHGYTHQSVVRGTWCLVRSAWRDPVKARGPSRRRRHQDPE